MTASRSCNMVWIYFRHIGGTVLAVYMDAFEVLSPEWLYFIDRFSEIFWKIVLETLSAVRLYGIGYEF